MSILDDDYTIDHKSLMDHVYSKNELEYLIIDYINKGKYNLNTIDVSNIIDMSYLFADIAKTIGMDKIKNIDISEWDVSNVENMNCMFFNCSYFDCDLSNWDVGNVKYMQSTFYCCYSLTSNFSKWKPDISDVNLVWDAFRYCDKIEKPEWYLKLKKW